MTQLVKTPVKILMVAFSDMALYSILCPTIIVENTGNNLKLIYAQQTALYFI